MKNLHLSHLIAKTVLLLAFVASPVVPLYAVQEGDGTPGNGAPFTGIYAFGDSLSDTGNFFNLTGQPGAPYFEGRVSNGIIWIEHLAQAMDLDTESVVSYAYAGATTGRININLPGLPGLLDEIGIFEAELDGKRADKRALYIVWAGGNDFFLPADPDQTIKTGVENTVAAVQCLYQSGARRILVVNIPDLGLTPYGQSGDLAPPYVLSALSAAYNATLDSALDKLEAVAGIETVRFDSAGVLQDIVATPWEFGFQNATDSYLGVGGDPAEFLFWDTFHPTTDGHRVIADEAFKVLREKFRHVWGTPRS